jgi:hypothetical protein
MRSAQSYETVFSNKTPITIWPIIAKLLKTTDHALENLRPKGNRANEGFLRNWRYITSFLALSKHMGSFDFSVNDLLQFDVAQFTEAEIRSTWKFIISFDPTGVNNAGWKRKDFTLQLCQAFSEKFSLKGIKRIEKSNLPAQYQRRLRIPTTKVDIKFVLKVNRLLPPQPWKPGVHKIVMKTLKCTYQEYSQAVQMLIDEGLRNRQKDGIVYDFDGNVISFDPERVDANLMKLKLQTDA